MAHDVTFEIPSRDLGKADVTFHIKKGGSKLGTLAVSKGSVVWFPKDHSYGYRIGWSEFDKLMVANGVNHSRRTQQIVAGERGIALFSTSF